MKQSGAMGPDMANIGPRRSISSSLAPWAQIWPKWDPEDPFEAVWRHGPRYGQNGTREVHLKQSGAMGPEITKIGPRRSISSSLAPWAQIQPTWHPGGPFEAVWRHGPGYSQNGSQEVI